SQQADRVLEYYTLEQIQKHKDIKNTGVTLYHKVYNLTKFLDKVPRGQARGETSRNFECVGYSTDAEMLKMYIMGMGCANPANRPSLEKLITTVLSHSIGWTKG
ncbi:Cytochrome b5, partial [Lemmus lemmus]